MKQRVEHPYMNLLTLILRFLHFDVFKILWINGFPVRKAHRILKQLDQLADYSEYHKRKCWEVYDFFYRNNGSYSDLCGARVNYWEQVPVTHRRNLVGPPDQWFPAGLEKRNLYRSSTSGSSGTPFLFARDALTHVLVWKSIDRFYRSTGVRLYDLQARFFGISRQLSQARNSRLKDLIACRYRFDVYDVSEHAVERWLLQFKQHPFRYIYGYSNTLIAFAAQMKQKGLVLKNVCPSLVSCIVTSEVCSEQDARLISQAFGIPVYNEYGSSELGVVGFKSARHWVCNDALYYLEVLDESGRVVPDGEVGLLTVTHLYNRATPLIRYQTGDLASIQRLPNGRVLITSLQGSVNDMAITAFGKKIPGISFYFVAQKLLDTRVDIHEFVVVQKSISQFVFQYVAGTPLSDSDELLLQEGFANYVDPSVTVVIQQLPVIERGANGKFKHFISEL